MPLIGRVDPRLPSRDHLLVRGVAVHADEALALIASESAAEVGHVTILLSVILARITALGVACKGAAQRDLTIAVALGVIVAGTRLDFRIRPRCIRGCIRRGRRRR